MLGLSRAVFAVPCDGVTTCERPNANGTTQSGWSVSASGVSGVKALVSVGPTGNQVGSQYYFGVSNPSLGATVANGGFTPGGSGARVISTAFATNASQTTTSTVFGGAVQQILGGTSYSVYAQACPSGTGIYNSAGCSAWTLIGSFSSSNYPASVFSAPVAPTDATINTIAVRTNVPTADQSNISLIRLDIHDLITPANNQTLSPIGFGGANGTSIIDNTMYTQNGGFKPNVKYEYLGKVVYPFNVDVPAAGQTRGPFWSRPALPGTVSASNVTHCSAQITALNSVGAPSNPAYTVYNLCASGTGGSCATDQISGATAGDSAVTTINNLNPGTAYTPTGQALVGNGDGSQTGWNSSAVKSGTGFSTLAWGGTFTAGNVTTTTADFTISGLIGAGSIASWSIRSGATVLLSGVGDPTGTHTKTALTPNTVYGTLQIVLTEGSGCSSTLNFTPGSITTTPVAPTAGTLSATGPRALQAAFTDGSTNPNGATTTYEVQVCLDAGFTASCASTTGSKAAGASQTITINTGIIPETQYFARVRARNQSRPTWPDSTWLNIGSATTPNEAPNIVSISHNVFTSSASLSANVTDNGAANQLIYHWSVTAQPGGATTSFTTNNSNAANPTFLNFNPSGAYTLQLQVCDKNEGAGSLCDTGADSFSPGQTPSTIDPIVAPSGPNIVVGLNKVFNAVVRDQFGAVIAGQSVSWTLSNGAATRSPASGTSTTVTGVNSTLSPVTLTASLPGLTSQNLALTILASGPQFTVNPSLTLNPDGRTGTLVADAVDNSPGAGTMVFNWTLESGPGAITVSPNNSNAAKNATVTFSKAGSYVLRCTITDNFASDFGLTSAVALNQNLTSIAVCPSGTAGCPTSVTLRTLQDQQFVANGVDQFGDLITLSGVTWGVTGAGSINSAGVFNSNSIGTNVTVTAQSGSISGAILVSLVSFDVSNAKAYPVPFKASSGVTTITFDNLGSQATIHVYSTSGRRVFETQVNANSYDWDVKNTSGESIASGVYFFVIESPEGKKNGKLIIIK